MQTIERALAIERRRDERAIYLRERTVIQLLPCLDGDLGHARGNAIGGLDRLVASPHSTGRRRGAGRESLSVADAHARGCADRLLEQASLPIALVTPKKVVAEPPGALRVQPGSA